MGVWRKAGLIMMLAAGLLFILGGLIIDLVEEGTGALIIGLIMGAMPLLLTGLAWWRPLLGGAIAIGLTIPILVYWIFGLFVNYEYEDIYMYSAFTLMIIFLIGSILVFTSVRKISSSTS